MFEDLKRQSPSVEANRESFSQLILVGRWMASPETGKREVPYGNAKRDSSTETAHGTSFAQ